MEVENGSSSCSRFRKRLPFPSFKSLSKLITTFYDGYTSEKVRIWADGCYDLTHFGHANNLRQAKGKGDVLVVGVHSDEDIRLNKNGRQPVLTMEERCMMVRSIKWVDEVIPYAPYVTTISTLDENNCQCCAHGNDITTGSDGVDTYQEAKDANRYKEVERAQGVSTTNLLKRILRRADGSGDSINPIDNSPYSGQNFIATTNRICEFAYPLKHPKDGDHVIYVDGTFDIFHPGHLAFLEEAKKHGDYLIVGIHKDSDVNIADGQYPIMNLQERALNILSCRLVDNVAIGESYIVSEELINHFNVSCVIHGETDFDEERYSIPIKKGIFLKIDSGSSLTTEDIVARVVNRKALYMKGNAAKERKEVEMINAMTDSAEQ